MAPDTVRRGVENQWCPGCSNFGVLAAVTKALALLDVAPRDVCLVSGIGQAAKLPHYASGNVFNGLHGRAIPAATGIKIANPNLTVLVTTGDGDAYGEGGNHLLHAMRRNPDITVVVHDNELYALTKGQGSPTTPLGERTRLQWNGVEESPLNVLAVAIVQGCGFVARGFAGDIDHLAEIFVGAVRHHGFSLVDVVQPCITWGPHPVSWYKERVRKLDRDHDSADRDAALRVVLATSEDIPIGVIYQAPERAAFGARYRLQAGDRALAELPLLADEEIAKRLQRFGT